MTHSLISTLICNVGYLWRTQITSIWFYDVTCIWSCVKIWRCGSYFCPEEANLWHSYCWSFLYLCCTFKKLGIYIICLCRKNLVTLRRSSFFKEKNVRINCLLWKVNQTLKVKRWQRGPSQSAYPPQVTPYTHLHLQFCRTHPSIPRSCLFCHLQRKIKNVDLIAVGL